MAREPKKGLNRKRVGKDLDRFIKANKDDLTARVEKFYNNPILLDDKAYLALIFAVMDKFSEALDAEAITNPKVVEQFTRAMDVASKIKERYHKQQVGFYIGLDKLELMQSAVVERIRFGFKEPITGCECASCPVERHCPRMELIARYISSTPVPE